jgi:hypothetical protein
MTRHLLLLMLQSWHVLLLLLRSFDLLLKRGRPVAVCMSAQRTRAKLFCFQGRRQLTARRDVDSMTDPVDRKSDCRDAFFCQNQSEESEQLVTQCFRSAWALCACRHLRRRQLFCQTFLLDDKNDDDNETAIVSNGCSHCGFHAGRTVCFPGVHWIDRPLQVRQHVEAFQHHSHII